VSGFYDIVTNPQITVNYVDMFDHDEFILMIYSDQSDQSQPHSSANVVVASFVTACTRLELYAQLEQLGQRVLYFDTDG
jgi:hypothetical protein